MAFGCREGSQPCALTLPEGFGIAVSRSRAKRGQLLLGGGRARLLRARAAGEAKAQHQLARRASSSRAVLGDPTLPLALPQWITSIAAITETPKPGQNQNRDRSN
ncbi:MAG: hypothetical protein JWN51_945 [Phycisphaerales bacterium]|nr:hypothetical protein [Phycisphaerales bacterium]